MSAPPASGADSGAGPTRRLSRSAGGGRPPAPARLAHLGLGHFFRAHQAWYTERAPDRDDWGYAAFTGRSAGVVGALQAQDGLYTVVTRSAGGDRFDVVASLSAVHPAADHGAWLDRFRSPELAAVTITVTEAGYLRRPGGGLDADRPEVTTDVAALRSDPAAVVGTAPGRLVAGFLARRRSGAGPLSVIPCDNLPGNGAVVAEVVRDLADRVDPTLGEWIDAHVAVVTTVVDRITPRPSEDDALLVARSTGWEDRVPVVTEPFTEWVLSGPFPAGRPRWEEAGARFVDDPGPFEDRKLWLLNGAHSLLAYAGSILGHDTVPAAAADRRALAWVEEWWDTAGPHVARPPAEVAEYRAALLGRFSNTRLADRLARIAEDGSQKLPVRVLPVLRAERAAGRLPLGATRILAAWVGHLRGLGAPVRDARADEVRPLAGPGPLTEAVPRVLGWLGADLAADAEVVAAVAEQCAELSRLAADRPG